MHICIYVCVFLLSKQTITHLYYLFEFCLHISILRYKHFYILILLYDIQHVCMYIPCREIHMLLVISATERVK